MSGVAGGAVTGFGFLLAGALTGVLGLVVWVWLVARRPRLVGASGGLIGLGGIVLLVIGQAAIRCTADSSCSQPGLTPWFVGGALLIAIGVAMGLQSVGFLHRR